MRYKTETEFARAIKKTGAQGLILLCGEEDFLIQNWRKTLLKPFGDEEGFNLQILDGVKPDLDAVYDATQMLPVFASQKCVVLEDLDPRELHTADHEKLEQIFKDLPPECFFLITSRAPAFSSRLASGKKLVTLADKYGAVLELDGRDRGSMVRFVQSQAKEYGTTITPELSRYVLDICHQDMQTLAGEMAKISAYAGGETITQAHIDAVASPRTEAKIFDLGRAITAGQAQKALEILHSLYYMRENPIAIVATLIMSYTDLYRARVAKDAGKNQQEVSAMFQYGGLAFRVRNAYRVPISTEAVRISLDLLFQCEKELKSTSMEEELVLEKTVLALLACKAA